MTPTLKNNNSIPFYYIRYGAQDLFFGATIRQGFVRDKMSFAYFHNQLLKVQQHLLSLPWLRKEGYDQLKPHLKMFLSAS